jgi:hypothetical protein
LPQCRAALTRSWNQRGRQSNDERAFCRRNCRSWETRRPPNPPRYSPLASNRAAISSRLSGKSAIVWPSPLGNLCSVRSNSLPCNLHDPANWHRQGKVVCVFFVIFWAPNLPASVPSARGCQHVRTPRTPVSFDAWFYHLIPRTGTAAWCFPCHSGHSLLDSCLGAGASINHKSC